MMWNWEQSAWPTFERDFAVLEPLEKRFLLQSGEFIGACKHVDANDQATIKIELISDEAVKTSEIEGEILNRESVQSSLRQQFGLGGELPGVKPAERGISSMMVDLYQNFAAPLSCRTLFNWHSMLLGADRSIKVVGSYRTHGDAMQVVFGPDYQSTIHFEAPPSVRVPDEMKRFVAWFNDSAPDGKHPLLALTRAGIVHLY